jgi:hypothetical protein
LIKGLGVDKVVWGTDSVWYGSPQWQIEAMRRLEIPEDMQKKHGFAPLGAADGPVKSAIFAGNAARHYKLDPKKAGAALRADDYQRHARALGRQPEQPALRLRGVTMPAPELLASYWTICGAAEPHTEREFSPFSLRERASSASRAGFTGMGIWHADLAHLRRQHSLPEIKQHPR